MLAVSDPAPGVLEHGSGSDEPLSPEMAFRFSAETTDASTITADWNVTQGYYLYRDKIHFRLIDAPSGVSLENSVLPEGDTKRDDDLGAVSIYRRPIAIRIPIQRPLGGAITLTLETKFQGCAENRLCYPPQTRKTVVTLPPLVAVAPVATSAPAAAQNDAEQDRVTAFLAHGNPWLIVAWFFGVGLLLAFTPCLFPMVPILSSMIVGQGKELTTTRAFSLSLTYVLAMAITYTVAGVVAGLLGTNLQMLAQNPWVILAFAVVFVALALSMFGNYELQLPSRLQNHLAALSHPQKGGTFLGVAAMGCLSALIVSPCVAPPLAGTLLYISQSGNAVLGGLALFSMSMGMGMPLLIIGTTGGRWLPRVGAWMHAIKILFGVLLLWVALEMLERVLPSAITMPLWAVLCIVCGVYLGALDHTAEASGWQTFRKGLGIVLLAQGVLVLIGAASGSDNLLQPLNHLRAAEAPLATSMEGRSHGVLSFESVASLQALDQRLATVGGRLVLLDFYADWCVECKRMEQTTFADPSVRAALSEVILLRVDVTKNTEADQAFLRRFDLFGPPALLFFAENGVERRAARLIGFADAAQLRTHLAQPR